MASSLDHEQHAGDGELLALYDRQIGRELDAWRQHVTRCADCQRRLAVISDNAQRVRESLSVIPIPRLDASALRVRIAAAGARRTVPWWRRPAVQAAAALVIVTALAAASPARHWLREHFGRATAPVAPPRAPSKQAPAPPELSGATVSFPASGPTFTMRLDVSPVTGSLVIERTAADQISVQVASGAGTGGDDMVVLPSELRVRNTTSSRASYRVSIPSSVTRVVVIVAGQTIFDGAPPGNVSISR
jgi:hypothetical protein